MKQWISTVYQWAMPKKCCFCEEETNASQDLCDICYTTLPWLNNACYRCGARIEDELEHIQCFRCQENPPPFYRLCAVFNYLPPIQKLMTRLKFSGNLAYGRILGRLVADQLKILYQKDDFPEAIMPVPLSKKRLQQRGYNQALELMRELIKAYPILPLLSTCKKTRNTVPQSELNKAKRHRNLKNVFKIMKPETLNNLQHIAIFDDVVTTGSTVKALAEILREQGVARIDVICCCRA